MMIQALLALGRFAGTRISEAAARTWGDVDFAENKVNIHNQYYYGEFVPLKSTKRRFGLFPEFKEVLVRWRNITPYPNNTDLIFMGETASRYQHTTGRGMCINSSWYMDWG
jgi:integrase